MLIVDGITSVGVFEQKMDEWGIDALVTGSQKALMLPPGLAMIALSQRALGARAEELARRAFISISTASSRLSATNIPPPTRLRSRWYSGLNKSLEMIQAETLPAVFARHRLMAEATRAAAPALGLKLLAPDNPAAGVTGILTPEGVDGTKLVRYMRDDLGVTIQGGQDHMKGKLARIGHMGYLSPFDMLVAVERA